MKHVPIGRRVFSLLGVLAGLLTLSACAASAPTFQQAAPEVGTAATEVMPTGVPTDGGPPTASPLVAQPDCAAPAEPAPAMTEGPYFKAGSPQRASLIEASTVGERLVLSGYVLSTDCQPIPNTLLDFWQADGNGAYDNASYGLRGHQFTDEAGGFQLTTVVPGQYPGRTEHIHVRVEAPGRPALVTQLFFPTSSGNQSDRIFDERLVIAMQQSPVGWAGSFNFILRSN
jgi:hypothetical protein